MSLIRSFLYRFPRFRTECPMDFIYGGNVVLGTCLDLSESGLRATLSLPVPAGTEGLITLYQGQKSVQIQARIDSVQEEDVRVVFLLENDAERVGLQRFIKSVSERPRS